jgi:hypothetical protein
LKPLLQRNVPHELQSLGSLEVSTQVPLHDDGALAGHVAAHANVPSNGVQTGVAPVHALVQPPQCMGVAGLTHAPLQAMCGLTHAASAPPPVSPASRALPSALASGEESVAASANA